MHLTRRHTPDRDTHTQAHTRQAHTLKHMHTHARFLTARTDQVSDPWRAPFYPSRKEHSERQSTSQSSVLHPNEVGVKPRADGPVTRSFWRASAYPCVCNVLEEPLEFTARPDSRPTLGEAIPLLVRGSVPAPNRPRAYFPASRFQPQLSELAAETRPRMENTVSRCLCAGSAQA